MNEGKFLEAARKYAHYSAALAQRYDYLSKEKKEEYAVEIADALLEMEKAKLEVLSSK